MVSWLDSIGWIAAALALSLISLCGCERSRAEPQRLATSTSAATFPVEIRQPPLPQGVATSVVDSHGLPVQLKCIACHDVRPANVDTSLPSQLDEFHQGMQIAHGKLTCVSCHQASDGYASLKLADGRSLPFAESMTLCAQCHGTQFRDYEHGAHGGMTGYWDLTRGGRTRNHCLHCHDPHQPKYPTFTPAAAPRDRFAPATFGGMHE